MLYTDRLVSGSCRNSLPCRTARSGRPFVDRHAHRVRCSPDDAPPEILGDWREFRAKLISQQEPQAWSSRVPEDNLRLLQIQDPKLSAEEIWAHPTAAPERGGLLLATPRNHEVTGNESFWQAVIFLIEHTPGAGSIGILLNRPSGMVLGRKPGGLPYKIVGAPNDMQTVFQDNRVYAGGDRAQQLIHIMHGHRLEKSVEVVPGVFMGGEAAASRLAAEGALDRSGFKFYMGAVMWEGNQLQAEIDAGAWYTAAASRPIILKQCLQLPVPLWREVMSLMGDDFLLTAKQEYEGDE